MKYGTSDVWIMMLKAIYTKLNANSDTFYYTKCKCWQIVYYLHLSLM